MSDPGRVVEGPGAARSAGTPINRRELLKLSLGNSAAAIPLAGIVDMSALRAAADGLKLANVQEFTTSCNFCS